MPIDTVEDLRAHLQTALRIEHATIPPYLTALYSIKDGRNREASDVIQSVVMEEMLHMTMVANVLNAIEGKPKLAYPGFVPDYPGILPHSAGTFTVGLQKLSRAALETFVRIEKPAPAHARPEADDWETIGQFYQAVLDAMERLDAEHGIFVDDPSRQVKPEHFYYGGGGDVVEVSDLESAKAALDVVVEQGEGLDHTIFDGDTQFKQMNEVAHYFRFNEMLVGRYYTDDDTPKSGPTGSEFVLDWSGVWNVAPNPKAERYEGQPEIHAQMVAFNRTYTDLLHVLERAFNGRPDELISAVPLMYRLRDRAQALVKIPTGDGTTTTVGPSFEFVQD
jgi:rubrerythrin